MNKENLRNLKDVVVRWGKGAVIDTSLIVAGAVSANALAQGLHLSETIGVVAGVGGVATGAWVGQKINKDHPLSS